MYRARYQQYAGPVIVYLVDEGENAVRAEQGAL